MVSGLDIFSWFKNICTNMKMFLTACPVLRSAQRRCADGALVSATYGAGAYAAVTSPTS